jgi:hypothetical protein
MALWLARIETLESGRSCRMNEGCDNGCAGDVLRSRLSMIDWVVSSGIAFAFSILYAISSIQSGRAILGDARDIWI